ncbi:MAG: DNA polymerase domain-containing protein [Desulfobaccales bacterium]
MKTLGWLFDLYPLRDRMVLWFITCSGERLRLEDDFPYCLYLGGPQARLRSLARGLGQRGWLRRAYPSQGQDLWTGREIPVVALEVKAYDFLPRLRKYLGALTGEVACYNCDIDIAAYYLYVRRYWPCAWYEVEAKDGRVLHLEAQEDPFAVEFDVPPLATLTLGLTRDPLIPLGAGNGLAVGWEGRSLELEAPDRPGLVRELAQWLKRANPDLVLSDWGDEEIIPTLTRWSREYDEPLPLDREVRPAPRRFSGGRSYFSYGRIVYQGSSAPFYGRWHLDRRNSFYYRESGLKGLIQIARIGQMPLQQAARSSPGTLITSMQLARAVADGILIPWRKAEPEHFKTAGELLTIDKGGLTFMPPPGLHTHVAEVDFASMYPTIMTIHNISPETVNCSCCLGATRVRSQGLGVSKNVTPPPPSVPMPARAPALHLNVRADSVGAQRAVLLERESPGKDLGATTPPTHPSPRRGGFETRPYNPWASPCPPVPEADYRLCHRREGLVPKTLRPILALREQLKARAKEVQVEDAAQYKERQTALKWMLVTCFGYLGYKNARFGRIEAHEAVTAYGRDKLLAAKEIFEDAGFTVLHGLTDCLWVQKPGPTDTGGTGVSPVLRRPDVQESPRSHFREKKIPPAPLFLRGVQSPPLKKGDLGGFEVFPTKHTNTPNDPLKANRYELELEDLCAKVSGATGVKLALEGVYRWIYFMFSKQDPNRPVATRYFGVFEDGSLKVRGLACRRRDTPPFVRRAQEAMLQKLTEAVTPEELARLKPELEEMAEGFRQSLREGGLNPQDLVITRVLSQKVEEYKVDTPTALAARQLEAAGIPIQPGEKVRYVHREGKKGPKECRVQAAPFIETLDGYDTQLYLELLDRAVEEILLPFQH